MPKFVHSALGLFKPSLAMQKKKRRRRKKNNDFQQPQKPRNRHVDNNAETPEGKHAFLSNKRNPRSKYTFKTNAFIEKMRSRLAGGQFRMLNEKLYTCSGEEAFKMFREDRSSFQCYHAGYQEQMSRWPCQPIEVMIDWIKARSVSLVVADFGCGDARLAKSLNNRVFSLDLVALDTSVIECNMAHTPLNAASIDVAIFCLSLMGTDYFSFLVEAYRILKLGGWLLIAEVRSRFDPSNGGANPEHFVKALNRLGFSLVTKDFSNRFFIMFEFRKHGKGCENPTQCQWPKLKACIYKHR